MNWETQMSTALTKGCRSTFDDRIWARMWDLLMVGNSYDNNCKYEVGKSVSTVSCVPLGSALQLQSWHTSICVEVAKCRSVWTRCTRGYPCNQGAHVGRIMQWNCRGSYWTKTALHRWVCIAQLECDDHIFNHALAHYEVPHTQAHHLIDSKFKSSCFCV